MSPRDLEARSAALAPIPKDEAGRPVFREPWEAQVFAMALALHERGLFTWSEWVEVLSAEIAMLEHEGDAASYRPWLSALEQLAVRKEWAGREHLEERRAAWDRAARATPHGEPIRLENDSSPKG